MSLAALDKGGKMGTWASALDSSGKLKRTPRPVLAHKTVGGFLCLFGESSATAHQPPSTLTQAGTTSTICSTAKSLAVVGTATLRYLAPRGRVNLTRQARIMRPREKLSSWAQQEGNRDAGFGCLLPKGHSIPVSRQGFLPGRTGLNLLLGIPLATRGLEEKPSSLRQGLRV